MQVFTGIIDVIVFGSSHKFEKKNVHQLRRLRTDYDDPEPSKKPLNETVAVPEDPSEGCKFSGLVKHWGGCLLLVHL